MPDYSEGLQLKIEDDDPRFNSALARGLAILRSFHIDQQFLANADIAERTGIPKPTVSRLTYTLTQLGYLRYREDIGKYEVAAGVVGLAYPYIAKQVVPSAARPLMLKLAAETNLNVGLGVVEGLSMLYLEYAPGDIKSNRRQRVGFRVPLVRTAMGRACASAMSPQQHKELLEAMQHYYPKEWQSLWRELEESFEQYQKHGYVISVGTFAKLTNTVAVPFIWGDSGTIMAFNAQGPAHLQTPARMQRIGKKLLALTDEVREVLVRGVPGPQYPTI
ncbi:IclR family transcriptional regulator [Variovorax saccharolyticus]|uniref:IclR family transcriptional regulator n=1 Tax=Variovorax saccharolyticus TaxID=3053516 RepID=UPI0025784E45|nr:IclR family transcriptional regulator [Variovorax sp. J22R187]MDM0021908.1 IclR family transcriptional regulator [Variovorax sp. J22R187]